MVGPSDMRNSPISNPRAMIGRDMDLPPGTEALISAVTAANPNTAVVIQSGTPVTMAPWITSTPALMQAWYGGNETGNGNRGCPLRRRQSQRASYRSVSPLGTRITQRF